MNNRSGAALVIAIVVLAAMLMLGLPFLFTQSSSLSGTRSYAHGRLASMGQDSAQSMGVSVSASAMSYHWQKDGVNTPDGVIQDEWTDLFHDLNGNDADTGVRRSAGLRNRIEFDTRNHRFALPGETFLEEVPATERVELRRRYPTVIGLAIEDESGKLNPNHLSANAWGRLLAAVNIADPPNGTPSTQMSTPKPLAVALAQMRYLLPGGRITHLDQLLQAEPPVGTTARRGLIRAELDRLRPYLSLSVPSQARGGMIDLGTLVAVDNGTPRRMFLDSETPATLLSHPVTPWLIGQDTTLLVPDTDRGMRAIPANGQTTATPEARDAIAIDAPPIVNFHQMEAQVRATFAPGPLPVPPGNLSPVPDPPVIANLRQLADLTALGTDALSVTRTPFDLLSPLSVYESPGLAQVQASKKNDPGAAGPFGTGPDFLSIDATSMLPVLEASVTTIRLTGPDLERFPSRGLAILHGEPPTGPSDPNHYEYIEYSASTLPLNRSAALAGTVVTLSDIRRGINPVTGRANLTAKSFKAPLQLTVITLHEQHPIGIASQGVITISSAATVTDAVGNQTAQDQHRVVAQALPQESFVAQGQPLEVRFHHQTALHSVLAQRHGSLMTSFPQPYPRLRDALPDASVETTPLPIDFDQRIGLRPAVMRTLIGNPGLRRDWWVDFAGTRGEALQANSTDTSTNNTTTSMPMPSEHTSAYVASTSVLSPEGLKLDANRVLAYPNPSNGLLKDSGTPTNRALAPIHGRQFALWVRPDATWTSSQVALLDMRMDLSNVSKRLTGESEQAKPSDPREEDPNDADISNRFSLIYDRRVKQLILLLNPGTIPHARDYGPLIPRQTYGPTLGVNIKGDVWPAVNPECLGSGGAHPMASAPQEVVIQHRYHVGDRFSVGEWHLIQVAFSSNQPGGMSIIVDGLVGRDVTLRPTDSTAMTVPGDHLSQPVLTLATALPTTEQVRTRGTRVLSVDSIALQAITYDDDVKLTGVDAVRRLLPKRGLIRIGREYISYQRIDETGALRDCIRGRRQRTHGGVDRNGVPTWDSAHVMEPHRLGAAVYPGGFAFAIPNNVAWWRGGCHLAQPMPDGDPTKKFQVWANLTEDVTASMTTIKLAGSATVLAQFPPRGWIRTQNGKEAHYNNDGARPRDTTPPSLLNVHHRDLVMVTNPDGTTSTQEAWIAGFGSAHLEGQELVLISQEIAGKDIAGLDLDPTQTGLYAQSGPSMFVQLYDARPPAAGGNAGRVEWISYSGIRSRTDYPSSHPDPSSALERVSYLINVSNELVGYDAAPDPGGDPIPRYESRGGFWFTDGRTAPNHRQGARARERTGFAAADFSDYNSTTHTFPALTTRVIPVQTSLEIAYLLEAGDVLTLVPNVVGAASGRRPIQMCVRYSADDAFPYDHGSTVATAWNSTNKHFAFSEAFPDGWNPDNLPFHLLSWPCWTPEDDLSQLNTPGEWRRDRLGWVLPWANAFAPDFTPDHGTPGNRRMTLLSTGLTPMPGVTAGVAATIDALQAGEQPGWHPGTQAQANIVQSIGTRWLDDEVDLTAELAIRTDQPVFLYAYGLIEVGGEVFAYRTNSAADQADFDRGSMDPLRDAVRDNQAWIIGRSLLGSTRREHWGPELVLHLPIGPVAEVIGAMPIDQLGQVGLDGGFNAPAMLLTSRNGGTMELTTMPNGHTAPWLRGMYNTTPVAWAARTSPSTWSNLAPLAIGWWPRYPSAYPKGFPTDIPADQHGEYLRSRAYAWAGFPLRFHDTQFAGNNLANVTLIRDERRTDGSGGFDVYAAALDGTLDWTMASYAVMSRTNSDVSNAFLGTRFQTQSNEVINQRLITPSGTPRAVDGAELRVFWSYRDPLLTDATAPAYWLQEAAITGGLAPMIGTATLRARAPNKVLNVDR